MSDRAPERLAAALAVLVLAAGAVLLLGSRAAEPRPSAAAIAPGTATTLVPCEAAFDRGIAGTCGCGLDPAPGGFAYCPHHAGPLPGR